ncbi:hypothetical protein JHN59_10595 [Streptomyces sp. MBT49]|uniref:hypothetical protein n=1 Tax=Streptomyces sp. MBT49 TaxID=1488380 RepID=UPI00190C87BD|nr:hypothetical protein [Streptomyces sp. MBT49]MBK3625287.1 hypothetical protein [Streptomyces sp. MBT49]
MSTVLMIVGLVLVVVGAVVLVVPIKEEAAGHGLVGDSAKLFEATSALLDRFDKRYRPGMIMMIVGLALVALGVFLEASDIKDAIHASRETSHSQAFET